MPLIVGELAAVLGLDDKPFQRGLDGVGPKVRGVASRAAGLFVTAGKALATFGGAATASLGGFGLKVAASTEQASIGFETLLGSADAAKAYMQQLSDFAAKTPFDMPDLRSAASSLIAVGTNAQDVIPIMTTLGDAISAQGGGAEQIDASVRALTQMQQKGKVTGEEMLQLAEAGVPAWDALANKMGVTVPEAQAMVSKGQVQVNTLFEALETKAGPALQRTARMMDKQSASLTGMLSTLKDTVGQGLGQMMAPAVDALKQQLPAITSTIQTAMVQVGPQIGQMVSGLASAVTALMPVVVPIIGAFAGVLGGLASALGPVFKALAPHIATVANILQGAFLAVLHKLAPVLPTIADAVGKVAEVLAGALGQILPVIAELFAQLVTAVAPLIEPLVSLAKDVLTAFIDAIKPILPSIAPLIKTLVAGLVPVIQQLAPMISQNAKVFGDLLASVVPLLPPLLQLVVALLPLIPPLLQLVMMSQQFAVVVLTKLMPVLTALVDFFSAVLKPIIDKVVSWFGDLADKVGTPAEALSEAKDAIKRLLDDIVGFFDGIGDKISSKVSGMWDGLKNAFAAAINWIINGWNSLEFKIPGFDPPGPGPKFGGFTLGMPDITPLKFHTGGTVPGQPGQEVLALLQAGETVRTPAQEAARGMTGVYIAHATFADELDIEAVMRQGAWALSTAGFRS